VCIWSIWVSFRRGGFRGCDARFALKVPLFPPHSRIDLCDCDRIGWDINERVGIWRSSLKNLAHRW
jgi:hypothetical protein